MSKANGATIKNDKFLQHVSLKDYKSIKNVEVDFKPGLNIIIGKNSSGKTNFINGMNSVLNFSYNELLDSEFEINVCLGIEKIEVKAINKIQTLENEDYDFSSNHVESLKINDKLIELEEFDDVNYYLFRQEKSFNSIKIKYGIHYKENAYFINLPFSYVLVNNGKISRDLMMVTINDNGTEFIQFFFQRLYINIIRFYREVSKIPSEELKVKIIYFSELSLKSINTIIQNYSPIQQIRLNPDFNIIIEDKGQKQTITNFYLEFLIDQSWLTFDLLSDGTKRLFYIVSEMLTTFYNNDDLIYDKNLSIILLEEPELGIHPHQLHQLMQFIKEQAKEKQVILTTHSPQVLDILEPDELDRIIICHYDSEKGTQLNHLTDQQIKKAKKYMSSEAFLSDYWRFSDLEPA